MLKILRLFVDTIKLSWQEAMTGNAFTGNVGFQGHLEAKLIRGAK